MRHFYAGTFMNREDLKKVGVEYPIKLEYYKIISGNDKNQKEQQENFGIEVMKTSYIHDQVETEYIKLENLTREEPIINKVLDKLKEHEVTPISTTYVVEDLLKQIG